MGENISQPRFSGYRLIRRQFINHDIFGGGTPDTIYITYSNFVVIALNVFGNIRHKQYKLYIYSQSMMVNGSL